MDPITGVPIIDWFLGLLNAYGYLLVAGFTIFENLFVIGSFTPGETIVMAAAFLSTPDQGHLVVQYVWIASVVGTMTGSNISYLIGRYGGKETLLRYGRRFRVDEEWIAAAEEYFLIHGSRTIFLSRFAAGFKNAVPALAGVTRMNVVYFQAWTLLGAVTYTSIMVAIGWFVGDNFDRALQIAAQVGYFGMALFLLVLVLALWGRRRFHKRRIDRLAERHVERDVDEIGVSELYETERTDGDEP